MSDFTLTEARLTEKQQLADRTIESKLREAALLLLGRREHSAQELAGKLASRFTLSSSSTEIRAVLAALQTAAYQSDERFSEIFVRERRSRGYGPVRIEQELRLRGIHDELIVMSVDRHDQGWNVIARTVRQKRFGTLVSGTGAGHLKEKARITRFLHYRGFLSGQIQYAMAAVEE